MKRTSSATAAVLAALLVGFGLFERAQQSVSAQAGDPHSYFNALVARADHWKSWSLRDAATFGANRWVTYNPSADSDPQRQDAAKVVVPPFYLNETTHALTRTIDATETVMTIEKGRKAVFPAGRVLKIEDEIVTVASGGWTSETTIGIVRGAHGTTPASHGPGAQVLHATNSLRGQVRLPLGTEDGNVYFFVWDAYWTDSYRNVQFNHKAFQFTSGGRDGDQIWYEPQALYGRGASDPYIGVAGFRSYHKAGGDENWLLTDGNMLGPNGLGTRTAFPIMPGTWTRYFVVIDQRLNDYDMTNVWMADETRDPVHVVKDAQISVRPYGGTPNSIQQFWLEFNSSNDSYLRPDGRDFVSYVRNFVALRNVTDTRNLLVRPVPGAAPEQGPAPPLNLRIVQ